MHHELVVELKQLPEDDVELLGEEDLLDGVREIGTTKRVAKESGQTLRYELEILRGGRERERDPNAYTCTYIQSCHNGRVLL